MDLSALPFHRIRAVFSDLDDTLTDHSKMQAETYSSLWALKEKGYWLVIVSGRPAGWADCLMRLWPLDAMVFENGAGYLVREGDAIRTVGLTSDKNSAEQHLVLQQEFNALKTKIPHLKLATDQPYRKFDFAIDYSEEPPLLSAAELQTVMDTLEKNKAITTKLSSIHVNYWYGTHTKVTACEALLANQGKRLGVSKDQVIYCGDSPNDEPLFEYFDHTVGVANIKKYLPQMKNPPRYLTANPAGRGFAEVASQLPRLSRG